ncbi:P22 phage major capsid protein family protein, partial [Kozakia baliensis]|uniref:P22 phage major capsid protein family protein n=1 Tax=Kozakia baliensis TaxID=153496 RepID=UPI00049821D9
MANQLINDMIITKRALPLFRDTNSFIKNVDRSYDSYFGKSGAKIGASVNVRLPNDPVVGDGAVVSPQSIAERSIPLTIAYRKHVSLQFDTQERTLNIDDFSGRYIEPSVNNLTGTVANIAMQLALGAANVVRNTDENGNTIAPTSDTWLRAKAKLTKQHAPVGDRFAVLDPDTDAATVSGLMGLFNPSAQIGDQTRQGSMQAPLLGVKEWVNDQTCLVTTTGSYDGAATATGSVTSITNTGNAIPGQISATDYPQNSVIATSALNGGLNVGDVITIAGVNQVNRVTKQSYSTPMQFVVTRPAASGATSIVVSPALVGPASDGSQNQYQTVDAMPVADAKISLVGKPGETIRRNLLFNKKALTLVTVDLMEVNKGVVDCGMANLDGISMRTL